MRKQSIYKLLAIAGILIVVFPASPVSASSISLVPSPTSITTGLEFGDTVAFDVSLDFSDVIDPFWGNGVTGGGLDISWDPAELSLGAVNQNASFGNPSDPFFPTQVSPPTEIGNVLSNWSFGDFYGVESGILGSIVFNVESKITVDALVSISQTSGIAGSWVAADGISIITPDYNGATVGIVSVPNPATLSLFAIGLVGLLGFTRRKKIN